jgi:hypothetical protein
MRSGTLKRWATAALVIALSACGGGGGGADGGIGGTGGGGDGGIGGTGVAYGGITGFGSVWVNGVKYNTDNASFTLDDSKVTQAQLRVGMVVRVDGSISGATANTVTVDESIKGRVEQVLDANRMLVMGQTIQIDAQTRFENGVVPGVGDLVEVHGLVVSDGTIGAGYIERKTVAATPPFAVKGFVKSHDTAAQSFVIGTLTVRYSGAAVNDMPAGGWNGQLVEVKGTACSGTPVCGTLTASKVEPNGPRVNSIAAAEFEGYVASTTANGFFIGAQQVVVTASTVYEYGVAGDVVVGAKLEAEGSISGGVLTATKVSFRDNVRLEADVSTAGGTSLTLNALPGLAVQVNSLTRFKDVASLAALSTGNHLRIRGRAIGNNTVMATEIERRSTTPDSRVILQGPTSSVANPSLTILGVVVDTSTVADSEFKDLRDAVVGRAVFFNSLAVGDAVKARGDLRNGVIRWDQMELED